jgi:DNA-binding NarL/FixJ family response regulator
VLFREGLARVLAESGFLVVGQAGDADALHLLVRRDEPDVVVTDIRMPPTNTSDGLLAAQRIRAEHPGVGVLVLSQYVETRQAIRLLHHSPGRVARGGSVIDPDVIAHLLQHRGDDSALAGLTGRERDILALIAEGRSNHAICERLFLSPKQSKPTSDPSSPSSACHPRPTTTAASSPYSCTSGTHEDLNVEEEMHMTKSGTADHAFPDSGADERRRLDLLADHLDPLTVRRIRLPGDWRRPGPIARWLCEYVDADGHVTATDLQTGSCPSCRWRISAETG